MTPEQALIILDEATQRVQGSRVDHNNILIALRVLDKLVKEKPTQPPEEK